MDFVRRKVFTLRNHLELKAAPAVSFGVQGKSVQKTLLGTASALIVLLTGAPAIGLAHNVYKIVDASGKVTYSDHIPASGGSVQIVQITRVRGVSSEKNAAKSAAAL